MLPWTGFLRRQIAPILNQALADAWLACQDADAVITNQLGLWVGYHVVEKLRVPLVRAYTWPGGLIIRGPRQTDRSQRVELSLGRVAGARAGPINEPLLSAARQVVWQIIRPWVNAARRQVLGLPPLSVLEPFGDLNRGSYPLLYGFSQALFPPGRAWADWVDVTGYWFLDSLPDWRPPTALERFIEAGPPPVFVGFGHPADRDPSATLTLITEALARAGQRGVLVSGWSGGGHLPDLPEHVFAIENVPYDWLFPRMAAVVHHGGAGTTAAGLRAGRPSVLVPYFADQPFWAGRVTELGVGPRAIPRRRISVERCRLPSGRRRRTQPYASAPQPWASASGRRTASAGPRRPSRAA